MYWMSTTRWHYKSPWWRHQMEAFSMLLVLCAGNSPETGEFPTQRPGTRSFDVFFYLRLNKRLSKQWRRWWYHMPSRSLWRHCNAKCWFKTRHSGQNSTRVNSSSMYMSNNTRNAKNMTFCHVRDLWKLSWSCKQLCSLCPPDPWNLPSTTLLGGFRSPWWKT